MILAFLVLSVGVCGCGVADDDSDGDGSCDGDAVESESCSLITNCRCESDDGWPQTERGIRAERSCPNAIAALKMYRMCDANGVWGSVDAAACPLVINSDTVITEIVRNYNYKTWIKR